MPIALAFALTLFNMVSIGATRVLVTLYALNLGAQPLTIGLLAATFAVFPMLLSWQTGKISDRLGPRRPLTFGAAIGVCGLLLAHFVPSLTVIFIAVALSGLAATFYNVSLQNLIGTLSNAGNRARNYSNYSMVIAVANAAGPLFAGFSIDRWGHATAFLCIAGLLVVPVVLLLVWGGILPGGRRDRGPARSIRHTLMNPKMWPVLAASGIAQSGIELFQVYLPVYAHEQGLSASAIGAIIATSAAGGFLARLLLTRLIAWGNEEKVLAFALLVGALAFVAVPFFKTALVLSIVAFIFGFGINTTQPIALMLLYARSPEGRSGEALGLRFALDNTARLVGPIVFGMVATALGLGAVFWLDALVLGAGALITRADARRRERKGRDEERARMKDEG
jgi:predicted MFS family arabinose efflux permease